MRAPFSLPGRLADIGFEIPVLARAGILGPDRPDRAARALAALIRGGQTLPTALRVAAIKHPERTMLRDREGGLTYAEVDAMSRRLGALEQNVNNIQAPLATRPW